MKEAWKHIKKCINTQSENFRFEQQEFPRRNAHELPHTGWKSVRKNIHTYLWREPEIEGGC